MKIPLLILSGLGALAFGIASYTCERASWRHEERGGGYGPAAVAHRHASESLDTAGLGLQAAAALSLAGFFITAGWTSYRVPNSVGALVGGVVSYTFLFFLGLSIMDDAIPEQRQVAGRVLVLWVVSVGCFLSSGVLGLSSKRLGGLIIGIIGLLAGIAILVLELCQRL